MPGPRTHCAMYLGAITSSCFYLLYRTGTKGRWQFQIQGPRCRTAPGLFSCLILSPWLELRVYWSTCPKGQHSSGGTTYLTIERVYALSQGVSAGEYLFMMQ